LPKDHENIRIAVVDDRGSVVDEFEQLFGIELPGATVAKFESADEALAAIDAGEEWSFWIVDLMMPIGTVLSRGETDDGLSTGIVVIKRLVESSVTISGDIIAFTLRDVVVADFQVDENIVILPKREHTPTDVVVRVRDTVNGEG
tara:strand:- start:30 stop:464 length:435 start_codon:yes stop_codon:yes gene_type:complete